MVASQMVASQMVEAAFGVELGERSLASMRLLADLGLVGWHCGEVHLISPSRAGRNGYANRLASPALLVRVRSV